MPIPVLLSPNNCPNIVLFDFCQHLSQIKKIGCKTIEFWGFLSIKSLQWLLTHWMDFFKIWFAYKNGCNYWNFFWLMQLHFVFTSRLHPYLRWHCIQNHNSFPPTSFSAAFPVFCCFNSSFSFFSKQWFITTSHKRELSHSSAHMVLEGIRQSIYQPTQPRIWKRQVRSLNVGQQVVEVLIHVDLCVMMGKRGTICFENFNKIMLHWGCTFPNDKFFLLYYAIEIGPCIERNWFHIGIDISQTLE